MRLDCFASVKLTPITRLTGESRTLEPLLFIPRIVSVMSSRIQYPICQYQHWRTEVSHSSNFQSLQNEYPSRSAGLA